MQSKLEQVFKEYISFKEYVEKNKKTNEQLKEEIVKSVDLLEVDNEEYLDIMFKKLGEANLEIIDLNQLATKFRNFYDAYKDFIEIPSEIKEEAEKITTRFLFTVIGDEKKIADQELYDSYKRQFIEENKKLK